MSMATSESREIALRSAVEIALRAGDSSADEIVSNAEAFHDFLIADDCEATR